MNSMLNPSSGVIVSYETNWPSTNSHCYHHLHCTDDDGGGDSAGFDDEFAY